MRQKTRLKLAQARRDASAHVQKNSTFKALGGKLNLSSVRFRDRDVHNLPTKTSTALPLVAALEKRTPEQDAILASSEYLTGLIAREPQTQKLLATMCAVRQAYSVAYLELQKTIDNDLVGTPQEAMAGTFTDYAVQIAAYEAAKPFDENVLIDGLFQEAFPTLADIAGKHQDAEDADLAHEQQASEASRRNRRIPIGLTFSTAQDEPGLPRDRTLVLVGWRPAVLWLLDTITTLVSSGQGEDFCQVVRLSTTVRDDSAANLLFLSNGWAGCTNSERSFAEFLVSYVNPAMSLPADLLVIDDLAIANSTGFVGRARGALAGDAHKRFRSWASTIGSAIVAAVPLETPDLSSLESAAFDQLKAFTFLRPVRVVDDETIPADHYRLSVADHAAVFDVPKTVLDSYGEPKLLLPTTILQ